MSVQTVNFFTGVSNGYDFSFANRKETEIIQGKNYYFASLFRFTQFAAIGNIFQKVVESASQTPASFSVKLLSNSVSVLSIPFALLCANVKHRDHLKVLDFLHKNNFKVARLLPKTLSKRAVRIFHFFAEHTGSLSLLVMAVQSLALIYFGQGNLGAGVLSMIIYGEADKRGYIPQRVRLLEKTYMPRLVSVGNLLDAKSTFMTRAIAFATLVTWIPLIHQFLSYKLDLVLRHYFSFQGFPLEEYDAPLVDQRNMKANQIWNILQGNDDDYELNPAHCSKFSVELPEDHQFDYLLTLFDEYQWDTQSEYRVIVGKLKEDRRFLDFLGGEFPEKNIGDCFDDLIGELAKREGKSKEVYVLDWVRSQMSLFVQSLKGEIIPAGTPLDLSLATSNSAKVIHYLKSSLDNLERKDILLKLAIEGGFYCSRGMKRASKEIVEDTIMPKTLPQGANTEKIYEVKTQVLLQKYRRSLVEMIYQRIIKQLPQVISEDPHNFDLYETILTLGFYPISALERQNIGVEKTFIWRVDSAHRAYMERMYRENLYSELKKENDATHFTQYIRSLINNNSNLTNKEKEALINQLASEWVDMDSFRRLMLVTIGVLRKKKD